MGGESYKKICEGVHSLDQPMPDAGMVPLSPVVYSLEFTMCLSAVLVRQCCEFWETVGVMVDNFVIHQRFDENLQCFRQAQRDVFGIVKITTLVKFIVNRTKSALYEACTEG